jgi:hypothetical protein
MNIYFFSFCVVSICALFRIIGAEFVPMLCVQKWSDHAPVTATFRGICGYSEECIPQPCVLSSRARAGQTIVSLLGRVMQRQAAPAAPVTKLCTNSTVSMTNEEQAGGQRGVLSNGCPLRKTFVEQESPCAGKLQANYRDVEKVASQPEPHGVHNDGDSLRQSWCGDAAGCIEGTIAPLAGVPTGVFEKPGKGKGAEIDVTVDGKQAVPLGASLSGLLDAACCEGHAAEEPTSTCTSGVKRSHIPLASQPRKRRAGRSQVGGSKGQQSLTAFLLPTR